MNGENSIKVDDRNGAEMYRNLKKVILNYIVVG